MIEGLKSKRIKYLRLRALASMHARDNDRGSILFGHVPKRLLCSAALLFFFFDETSVTGLRVGVDFGLILFLDVVGTILEWQVVLCAICDRADVENINPRAEQSLHRDRECQLRGFCAVNGGQVILASFHLRL